MNSKRRLIQKNEGKISVLQIIGFILILLGVISFIISSFYTDDNIPSIVAVSFFMTMLGMAFAFPSLLEGTEGLSTMRIVVFMMTNVICMLLLKIGWAKEITSLTAIGLNQYWMGVIAFVFGAKATQSFFESRMAGNSATDTKKNSENIGASQNAEINLADIQQVIADNKDKLRLQFPNIINIIPSFYTDGNNRVPCIDICISDNNKKGMPDFLVPNSNDNAKRINTRIISDFGNAKPQVGRGDFVLNSNFKHCRGTIACVLNEKSTLKPYLLTCNHVLNGGDFSNPGSFGDQVQEPAYGTYLNIGTWVAGMMNNRMDAALVSVNEPGDMDPNDIKNPVYTLSENDCGSILVEMRGAMSDIQRGYIIHINQPFYFDYNNMNNVKMENLISISASNNSNSFVTISEEGDSGALIYHSVTRQPIGMVIGGNAQFTYAIPIDTILSAFPGYKLSIK